MQELHAGVRAGAVVRARGEAWTIVEVRRFDHCALVVLEGRGAAQPDRRATLIAPFDTITLAHGERLPRRRRSRVAAAVLAAIGRERRARGLWTAVDGRFEPLAWQVAPALAVLGGATRVLLADGVGLGKTVQAGLVLAELMARGLAERALVLTPASLRDAWVGELRARFHLGAEALDQATLLAHGAWQEAGANPWTRAPIVVSSIDLVKRPEVRAAVDDQPIDLLVVDEAHHCTPGSDRGAAVARLARAVPWLVLASATPHAGDPRAFRYLLDLGRASGDEPAMRIFRRTRREVGLPERRSTHVLAVTPTDAERRLLESVHAYARELQRGPMRETPGLRLVCGVLARRATSSALAARRTLARRLAALSGRPATPVARQAPLPWSEVEEEERLDPSWLGAPGLQSTAEECARLRQLVADADEAGARPSKLLRLRSLLERASEPAIVFTEFRDTIEACLPFVEGVAPTRVLHGSMDVRDRRRAVSDFLEGRARVLLATDVAGEGLNLHERARLVITIEWPWSPQRLEQRVGRVDRLGQARRVHAVHFTSRGTFEDTVVARLLQRARTAAHDLEPCTAYPISESVLEAAVLGGDVPAAPSTGTPLTSMGPDTLAWEETGRILGQRRLGERTRAGTPLPAWCLPGRRARARAAAGGCEQRRAGPGTKAGQTGCRRVAALFEVCHRSRSGRLDAGIVVGIEVTLAHAPAHRREWRTICRAVAHDRRVRAAALAAAPEALATGSIWAGVVERLDAIRAALAATPATEVQASLFDRRAVRDARARNAVVERLRAHLDRKAVFLSTPGDREARVLAIVPLP